ncbi:MAG: SPFH/Band 7/PHB domain protein [Bacteriovorax sp.]|nr:SPFH/Band 7/PHB domain protein [Bacteriovorax sp.]
MNQTILGFTIIWGIFLTLWFIKRITTLSVENETEVLVTSFGKLIKKITEPGMHFYPHFLPWVTIINVSKKTDHLHYTNLQVNDVRGTTLVIDLWLEYKIEDTVKALFHVENWEESIRSLTINLASSHLSGYDFHAIHTERLKLSQEIKKELQETLERWGINLNVIFIRKVSLTSEISHQMFNTIAAKLEKVKANIEEEGRLKVAILEADTNKKIAELTAHAKGQYPKAIGNAYAKLSENPQILNAYVELYELSQIRPHRTTTFHGFSESEHLNTVTASLLSIQNHNHSGDDQYL